MAIIFKGVSDLWISDKKLEPVIHCLLFAIYSWLRHHRTCILHFTYTFRQQWISSIFLQDTRSMLQLSVYSCKFVIIRVQIFFLVEIFASWIPQMPRHRIFKHKSAFVVLSIYFEWTEIIGLNNWILYIKV